MGLTTESRFTYFYHHQQKPVTIGKTKGRCPASCASRGVIFLGTTGCLVNVLEGKWMVYACNTQCLLKHWEAWDISVCLYWQCACSHPARCRIRNNTDLSEPLPPAPFHFPGWLCSLIITTFPSNKSEHASRSWNNFIHLSVPFLYSTFPSVPKPFGQKVTCSVSVKYPC